MSVKIGIGFGGWPFPTADPDYLWEYTDLCESLGVDSLWLSDRVVSDAMNVEPVVALSVHRGAHHEPEVRYQRARSAAAKIRPCWPRR